MGTDYDAYGAASHVITAIKERLSIVDVVGQHVALERSGRSFKGRCPFHTEKTPSFYVFPERGNYRCFGCDAGGDLFTFVQQTQHLDFNAALRQLAERANVAAPSREIGNELW